jgi:hypothetical protein
MRTYTWLILSCGHWYKSDAATAPAALRCPTCDTTTDVIDTAPVTR